MALCPEVKSTGDGTSTCPTVSGIERSGSGPKVRRTGMRVLVVHPASGDGPPKRLDLLPDPVGLVKTGQLTKTDDGYELAYRAG